MVFHTRWKACLLVAVYLRQISSLNTSFDGKTLEDLQNIWHVQCEGRCSNNGVCNPFFANCTCFPGFKGDDCEEMKNHSEGLMVYFYVTVFVLCMIGLAVFLIPKYVIEKKRRKSLETDNVQDVIFIPSIDGVFGSCDFIGAGLDNAGAVVDIYDKIESTNNDNSSLKSVSLKSDEDSSMLTFINRTLKTVDSAEPLIAGENFDLSGIHVDDP